MIVTLEISRESLDRVRHHGKRAGQFVDALAAGLESAAVAMADAIAAGLVLGRYRLTARHPGSGLAASLRGWMIDAGIPMAAVGVPSDAPAAAYAAILNVGGTITPRTARALAVPVSEEARRYESPRDMEDLFMVRRPGRPPLLCRELTRRGSLTGLEVHWVLLRSVTIPASHWFDDGVRDAAPVGAAVLEATLDDYVRSWS